MIARFPRCGTHPLPRPIGPKCPPFPRPVTKMIGENGLKPGIKPGTLKPGIKPGVKPGVKPGIKPTLKILEAGIKPIPSIKLLEGGIRLPGLPNLPLPQPRPPVRDGGKLQTLALIIDPRTGETRSV